MVKGEQEGVKLVIVLALVDHEEADQGCEKHESAAPFCHANVHSCGGYKKYQSISLLRSTVPTGTLALVKFGVQRDGSDCKLCQYIWFPLTKRHAYFQPVLRIRITLMRIRIRLFTLMRMRIRMRIRILDPDPTVN